MYIPAYILHKPVTSFLFFSNNPEMKSLPDTRVAPVALFPGTRSSARLHPISHILTPSGACSHDTCEILWSVVTLLSCFKAFSVFFGDFYWLYQWSIFCITYLTTSMSRVAATALQNVCSMLWVYVYTCVRLWPNLQLCDAWLMDRCDVAQVQGCPRTLRFQWSHRSHGGSWWI